MSVFDEEKRSHMTGTDVARFFNAIGRKAAVGVPGETTFPMGSLNVGKAGDQGTRVRRRLRRFP